MKREHDTIESEELVYNITVGDNRETHPPTVHASDLRRISNDSIVLDHFDRVFSYFDQRSYEERELSKDFLEQCEGKAKKNLRVGMDLTLLVPTHCSTEEDEMVSQRICQFFKQEYEEKREQLLGGRFASYAWIAIAVGLIMLSYFLQTTTEQLFLRMVIYAYDIVAWYVFWVSADHAFTNRNVDVVLSHQRRMSKLNVMIKRYSLS
ncbi:delta(8)-fatty-acid desaturase [Acrasis kona]|uniref:Delta(8)-fatty-acid desaturase n=1 Tax=Acrasis kona TaxID=1008807 RepID=A0AAW2ZE96_9EUKA